MSSRTRTTPRNAGLPDHELAALRASLLDQRAFRQEQLATLHRHPPANATGPADGRTGTGYGVTGRVGEQGQAARDEVRSYLAVAARIVLADVEAALDRMETGHYGECRSCRAPIDLARLRVCPQAMHCAECHRRQETAAE
ncbi:TraR/DksA C4-type zinc finger protein [Kribbella sp. NPDC048915]|uniref:TraR/DksA family transcriptional regulator n=1 Tax=Kribbella sp. NPDC048915 TaxID=3155148 RepID=UPI00340A1A59